ncbi:MAG: hypothetical protein J0L99_01835 [Chitinophagales bacterium]|nr:hypothetical protein [Chitinophagales bacterium]
MDSEAVFLDDVIDESIEMQTMHPALFDDLMADGWRLLGRAIVRHNFAMSFGQLCRTIPLRVRLDNFRFSRSQQRLLRRNRHLRVESRPILLTPEKETLFAKHAQHRFLERRPESLISFLSRQAHQEPVRGQEYNIFDPEGRLLACSFVHFGEEAVSATYCFFDPEYSALSLGNYTMLLELSDAIATGKKYYYHGYCYDIPSQFDYKRNFNGLERLDWRSGNWEQSGREPLRSRDFPVQVSD